MDPSDTVANRSLYTVNVSSELPFVVDVDFVNDTLLAANGFFDNGLIALLNARTGRLVRMLGELPKGTAEAVQPAPVRNGDLEVNRSQTTFVVSQRHGGHLFIVGMDGTTKVVSGPDAFDPAETLADARRRDQKVIVPWGYVNMASTNDAVYGLFSGRVQREPRDSAGYASVVHEFGWDGRLRNVYRLDAAGIALAVQGRTLYLVVHDPAPAIRMYELPN